MQKQESEEKAVLPVELNNVTLKFTYKISSITQLFEKFLCVSSENQQPFDVTGLFCVLECH